MKKSLVLFACLVVALLIGTSEVLYAQSPITYTLPKAGKVSLAIYNKEGRMVREILRFSPQAAGKHTVHWDGFDREGKPVPAGEYSWKLLNSQGMKAEYLFSLGTSTKNHHWPAIHGGPSAVAVEGGELYIAGGGSEGAPGFAKIGLDGSYRWGQLNLEHWDGASDMAVVGNNLYIQYPVTGTTHVVNKATGVDTKFKFQQKAPLLRLLLGEGAPPEGFTSFAPQEYSAERGYGWKDATKASVFKREGKSALELGGQGGRGKAAEEISFIIDVPRGLMYPGINYNLRLHLGNGEKPGEGTGRTIVNVNGKWFSTFEATKVPGGMSTVDGPVAVIDGKMEITFYGDRDKPFDFALRGIELTANAQHMDARGEQLVVSLPGANQVQWIDPASGATVDTATVPKVRDVALLTNGDVLAVSGDSLVTLNRANKTPQVRVSGLTAPHHVAVDPATGDVFLTQSGDSQQVLKFDRNYKRTATFGRDGGRKFGTYVAKDFSQMTNVAADGKGGFVITEWLSPPRRTAHFDGQGRVLDEWFGGQLFYNVAAPAPDNVNRVWFQSHWGTLVEAELDYDRRSWKPRATYNLNADINQDFILPIEFGAGFYPFQADFDADGKKETYLWSDAHAGLILRPDEKLGKLVPVAALGAMRTNTVEYADDHPWVRALALAGKDPAPAKRSIHSVSFGYSWADANGNGKIDAEEIKLALGLRRFSEPTFRASWMDEQFNIYQGTAWGGDTSPAYRIYRPQGFTKTGIPLWDWEKSEAAPISGYFNTTRVRPDGQGNIYSISKNGGDGFSQGGVHVWGGHGAYWPATMSDSTALFKRNLKGEVLWQVAPHAGRNDNPRGQVQDPQRITAIVNNTIGVTDKVMQPCEFWTTDGLYAGGLFDRRAADGLPDSVYMWWRDERADPADLERFKALVQYDMGSGTIAQRPNGDVLFFGAGWNNFPIYRVTGWDEMTRQNGTIKLQQNTPASSATGTGLQAEYFANPALTGEPAAKRTDSRIWFGGIMNEGYKKTQMTWPEAATPATPFSMRWTGMVEAKFTENYTFAFYARNSGVRLWIGDELLIDNWDKEAKTFGKPIALQAGKKYPIKIEYRQLKPSPEAHLNWESLSQPIEHIPSAYLYP